MFAMKKEIAFCSVEIYFSEPKIICEKAKNQSPLFKKKIPRRRNIKYVFKLMIPSV